jgi:hypothetical protein
VFDDEPLPEVAVAPVLVWVFAAEPLPEDDAELEVLVFADDEPAGVVVDVWPVAVVLAWAPDVGDADWLGDVVAEEGVVDVVVV